MNKIITFFAEISQQTLKSYEKIAIITQIWHKAKFYFTRISGVWYLIIVLNMKKIHMTIMEECARTDWPMARQTMSNTIVADRLLTTEATNKDYAFSCIHNVVKICIHDHLHYVINPLEAIRTLNSFIHRKPVRNTCSCSPYLRWKFWKLWFQISGENIWSSKDF